MLDFDAEPPNETDREIERELSHMKETYPAFTKLRRLPDFLSLDDALSLMPDEHEQRYIRERCHTQLEGGEEDCVFGEYLDEAQERLFALWLAGNLSGVLAVYDGSRLAGKRLISRGKPTLGHVLDEMDGTRPEILIVSITTMSVCCLPMQLTVLRVGKHGSLSEVLRFPRGHAEVGPGVRWSFLNHFEFKGDRVVVSSVVPKGRGDYELPFDKGSGRFRPSAATARRIADDQRASTSDD